MKIDKEIKKELKVYLEEKLKENKKKAVIFSSYKLSDEEIKIIVEKLPFLTQYTIINLVDSSIFAGIIVEFESKIIDLSLRGQLNKFKNISYELT